MTGSVCHTNVREDDQEPSIVTLQYHDHSCVTKQWSKER